MQLNPVSFGSVTISYPVVLAPMAGYTDAAMRTLCFEQGAGAVYSELTSAEGICRDSEKTFQVLETSTSEHPIAGHIFGRNPASMADAARYIEQTGMFDWVDINMGCPVKKVVSRGAGAALMKDLVLLGQIIEAVKAAVSLPVSIKTRIGFNQTTPNHLDIAKVVEQSGADMMAVHARMAKDFHGGDPDWEKLGEMKRAVSIPVIGNGGVVDVQSARSMVDISGVDGVMVGRGAIGNPWIFEQIKQDVLPEKIPLEQRYEMMAEHLKRLVELNTLRQKSATLKIRYSPEEAACIQFRTHIPHYVRGLFDKKQLLMKLAQLTSVESILQEVALLMSKNR